MVQQQSSHSRTFEAIIAQNSAFYSNIPTESITRNRLQGPLSIPCGSVWREFIPFRSFRFLYSRLLLIMRDSAASISGGLARPVPSLLSRTSSRSCELDTALAQHLHATALFKRSEGGRKDSTRTSSSKEDLCSKSSAGRTVQRRRIEENH